ncbi:hypothetical protein [Corynebacterium variabile]
MSTVSGSTPPGCAVPPSSPNSRFFGGCCAATESCVEGVVSGVAARPGAPVVGTKRAP